MPLYQRELIENKHKTTSPVWLQAVVPADTIAEVNASILAALHCTARITALY